MAEQPQSVSVNIDGAKISVPKGTLLVEAAKLVQKEIPVYCYHPKLGPAGLCRICLVEIEGMPKLQIACNTPVTDGMVVHTYNDKVNAGRRAVLEFFLLNHPLDCPICDKGGECDLQDFSMAYGQGASRLAEPKVSKPKAVDLGPTIVLDEERCIVCQRCVRFDDIITGERSLIVKDRGYRDIIATATDDPYRSNFSGNVTELCPVGALTSKTYRFKSRPWDLHRTTTTCTQCAVGCQMQVDERVGEVARTMSIPDDDAVSDGWLCDRGRYNIGFYRDERRLQTPLYRVDGQWTQVGWDDAFALWAKALREAVASGGEQSVGVLGGGRLLNEEAYLLQHLFRSLGVRNLDWRAGTQRQATPGSNAGSLQDLENAQAIVLVGESPAQLAPVMDLRIRKAVSRHRAKLIRVGAIDPLPVVACTTLESAAEVPKALPAGAERVALVWDGVDPKLAREVVAALSDFSGLKTFIASGQNNARGAEVMGMHPAFGPGFAEVDGGKDFSGMVAAARSHSLRALSIFGANPALHYPDGVAIREALRNVPFLAVADLFLTETAQAANLVLPACGGFEKTGTTVNVTAVALPVNAALEPPEGALTDLEMLGCLARALEVQLPSVTELENSVIKHLVATAPSFGLGDAKVCGTTQFGQASRTGGPKLIARTDIFSGGGTVAHDGRIESLRPLPEAAVSPACAQQLGLSTGDCCDLRSGDQTMHDLLVEVRPGLADDVVVVVAGLPDDPANALGFEPVAELINVRRARELAPVGVSP
ncbi:MAG: NADH dehydrogenase (quinone) subunit G [Candidatus Meridianibacter frigidus]|nr:MAG: NADH dehydrogenase (quinone) subunit G [Candidatus Eremiobacteraeota bacterium]